MINLSQDHRYCQHIIVWKILNIHLYNMYFTVFKIIIEDTKDKDEEEVWERERERDRQTETEGETEITREILACKGKDSGKKERNGMRDEREIKRSRGNRDRQTQIEREGGRQADREGGRQTDRQR